MSSWSQYRTGSEAETHLFAEELPHLVDGQFLDLKNLNFISGVTTIDRPIPNRLVFLERFTDEMARQLSTVDSENMLFVVSPEYTSLVSQPRLITTHPREEYTNIVRRMFDYDGSYWSQDCAIHQTAKIDPSTRLAPGVSIGRNSVVGRNCVIYPNVVVGPNCSIGDNCVIKSGTVIGQSGFGIFQSHDGLPMHFPHVGGVVIENDVEIGALNTICSGSIHPTIVCAGVKTDDHVHVAHNCAIGARTLITACAELSGSVIIGEGCWIGPNSSICDGLTVGDRAFVGIGATVTKAVPEGVVVGGNPARQLRRSQTPSKTRELS
jgi:UDP-3-O-[3-hydroxymyristoyl] glucosamine N-acyltransferase